MIQVFIFFLLTLTDTIITASFLTSDEEAAILHTVCALKAPRPGSPKPITVQQEDKVSPTVQGAWRDATFRNLTVTDKLKAGTITINNVVVNAANVAGPLTAHDITVSNDLTVGGTTNLLGSLTVQGLLYQLGNTVSPNNILYVQKGPITAANQFNTITDALNTITTNSSTNRFVILVSPGKYQEPTLTLKPYVDLIGTSAGACIIEATSNTADVMVAAPNALIASLTLQHANDAPGSGATLITYSRSGTLRISDCNFGKSDILLKQTSTNESPFFCSLLLQDSRIEDDSNFSTGLLITDNGPVPGPVIPCTTEVVNLIWSGDTNPYLVDFLRISGTQTFFTSNTLILGSANSVLGTGNAFNIQNGARLQLTDITVNGFNRAVFVPAIGSGPSLNISGILSQNTTDDVRVNHPSAQGSILGTLDRNKTFIDTSASLSLLVTDPTMAATTTVGPLYSGNTIGSITNVSPQIQQGSNIGVISGGELITTSTSLTIGIAAGTGYLMNGLAPDDNLQLVSWPAQDLLLTETNQDQFIFIDSNGMAQYALSQPSILGKIILGKVRTTTSGILYTQLVPKQATHTATRLDQTIEQALGPIYKSGSLVTKNGTLQLDVSNGNYFYGTHEYFPTGGTAISWNAFYHDGSGNYVVTPTNLIDYQFWDDGSGTLAAIPADAFAKHELFVVGDGSYEAYTLLYSQTIFSTLNEATTGDLPTTPSSWTDNIAPIASIIVQNSATPTQRIQAILDERPRLGFSASSVAGVTVHGNLLGLLADDHPQYLLVNGNRAMTGDLNMNNNNIITGALGLVDGVDVSAHASRHLPLGADPLATDTPVTIGLLNNPGIANAFARSDHIHAHGSQTDPALHAVATQSTAGFMSASDKTTLDTLTTTTGQFVRKSGDTMTGSLIMPAGTAAAPSLAFTGSTTTGLSAPSTDTLVLSTAANGRVTVGATGAVTIATPTSGTGLTVAGGGASITGTTTINTSGTATITLGNASSTTTITGTVNMNTSGGATTNIGTGTYLGVIIIGNPDSSTFINNNLTLPQTNSTATQGIINLSTSRLHTFGGGTDNIYFGTSAGNINVANTGTQNIGLGAAALAAITSGSNNVALGTTALFATTSGTENIALGLNALLGNTSGNQNIAVGANACKANTTANFNVAVGLNALLFATTGNSNVAVGVNANATVLATTVTETTVVGGSATATADRSTSLGVRATASGTDSVALGSSATASGTSAIGFGLNSVGSGSSSIALGSSATASNTNGIAIGIQSSTATNSDTLAIGSLSSATGLRAIAVGRQATSAGSTTIAIGYIAATGSGTNGIFIGNGTGNSAATGSDNIGVGASALAALTSGASNIAIGNLALTANTTGSSNIAIGANATQAGSPSQSTAVGKSATASANNSTALGYNTTASGTSAVAVGDTATAIGSNGIAIGINAATSSQLNCIAVGNAATTGGAGPGHDNGIAIGKSSMASRLNSICIGNTASSADIAAIAIGNTATASASSAIAIGDGVIANGANGINIGSATAAGASQTRIANITGVTVTGAAVLVSATDQLGVAASARKYKENFRSLDAHSTQLYKLNPLLFDYKQEYCNDGKNQFGLIAEEVEPHLPELVLRDKHGEITTIAYHNFTPLLLNEIIHHQNKLVTQEQVIHNLVAKIDALQTEVSQLQTRLLTSQPLA